MDHKPTLSIGMPVFNGAKHLKDAIESILSQSLTDLELIICDNASADETAEICCSYAKRDRRVQYIRHQETLHPLVNFNWPLKVARGEYFMWAAHDDTRTHDYAETLLGMLAVQPRAVLAFGGFVNIDEVGKVIREFSNEWREGLRGTRYQQFKTFSLTDDVATQKANPAIYGVIRRSALQSVGGMLGIRGMAYCGEDVITLLSLLCVGEFAFDNRVLFYYRVRPHSVRPANAPLLKYLRGRLAGATVSHRGSLASYLKRNHAMHAEMRTIVRSKSPLTDREKWLLCRRLWFKELFGPLKTVPRTAWREICARKQGAKGGVVYD